MSKTTIVIKTLTREKLKQIGRKNQTYDELINELIRKRNNRGLIENLKLSNQTDT
jgi:predicted CopG family antitoxin